MQQGALAATALAGHRHKFAISYLQVDILEGLDLLRTLTIGFSDAL